MCGFGIHLEKRPHRFDQLKERSPKEWEYWMYKCCTDEESAEMICERKGFVDEYWKWVKENGDNEIGHLMRDFLSEVKGYCLIHNPTGCGGYIVTNMKSLTKRQKEFLYGYFMDMGDRFKAEQFIKE